MGAVLSAELLPELLPVLLPVLLPDEELLLLPALLPVVLLALRCLRSSLINLLASSAAGVQALVHSISPAAGRPSCKHPADGEGQISHCRSTVSDS